jgi:hypothetical protein
MTPAVITAFAPIQTSSFMVISFVLTGCYMGKYSPLHIHDLKTRNHNILIQYNTIANLNQIIITKSNYGVVSNFHISTPLFMVVKSSIND